MSNIDKQALREAAEKATPGEWAVEFDDEIYSTDGVNHEQIAMVFSENEARDAAFIAAANPATVLALLDELEAAAKQNALDVQIKARLCRESNSLHDRLREAAKRIADYQDLISGLVGVSSSILREVERINNAAAAGKGE